jgi:hypothetical protein
MQPHSSRRPNCTSIGGAPERDTSGSRQLRQQGHVGVRHHIPPELTDMPRTHVVGCYVIRQHVHCASKHKRSKQGRTSTASVSTWGGGVLHIDALPHNKSGAGGGGCT